MRTETIEKEFYQFDELDEQAQQTALEQFWDINVDYDWWTWTYEDAKRVDLEITGFDIDRGSYCSMNFLYSAKDTAEAILKEHGEKCDTNKTAREFLDEYNHLVALKDLYEDISEQYHNYTGNEFDQEVSYEFSESATNLDYAIENLEEEFLNDLSEDYRIILTNEYEYLTSEKAIVETIHANDYEFDIDGNF